jgi:hypothetical protein
MKWTVLLFAAATMWVASPHSHPQRSESHAAPAVASWLDLQSPAQTTGMNASQPAGKIQTLTKALAGTWNTSEKYERAEPTPNGLHDDDRPARTPASTVALLARAKTAGVHIACQQKRVGPAEVVARPRPSTRGRRRR